MNSSLHPDYDTGRLDLSPEEIHNEQSAIYDSIKKRHPKTRHPLFRNQTPQEIHRLRVLSAMDMAQSCLIYGETRRWNERYSKDYLSPLFMDGAKPYYRGTETQRNAHALTKAEVDAVFSAQKEVMSRYRIHRCAATDGEGVTYNTIEKIG